MINLNFSLKSLLPYLYGFPVLLIVIVFIFMIGKRKINNKSIAFYGMFMGLEKKDILSISLLFIFYYIIVVSIFLNDISLLVLIIMAVPILLFNLVNFYVFKLVIDCMNTILLFALLYSKAIFYSYMVDVASYWYVITLYVLLCLFILFYTTYVFIRRLKSIIAHNKYVENKK